VVNAFPQFLLKQTLQAAKFPDLKQKRGCEDQLYRYAPFDSKLLERFSSYQQNLLILLRVLSHWTHSLLLKYRLRHPSRHPIVRSHPETGRKALYLGGKILKYVIDMDARGSADLLDELYMHCTSEAFIYRHKWTVGDVVFWDNRCTMHFAQPYDDRNYTRHMHRTTVQGDVPV